MVLPLLAIPPLAGLGGFLAGKFLGGGGGSGGIEIASRNELPINIFGSQQIDKSTNSAFNNFTSQTTEFINISPIDQSIRNSPNSTTRGTASVTPTVSPSLTNIPTFIPTGAGGQSSLGGGGGSEAGGSANLIIIGALAIGGFILLRKK